MVNSAKSVHILHMGVHHGEVEKILQEKNQQQPGQDNLVNNEGKKEEKSEEKTEDVHVVEVSCTLCQSKGKERLFQKRTEYLKHLCLVHFGRQILQMFPFTEGESCKICLESNPDKNYVPAKKELHVCHMAILHQKLFQLLPSETMDQVNKLPSSRQLEASSKHKEAMIDCRHCNETVPRSRMKGHLVQHRIDLAKRKSQGSDPSSSNLTDGLVNLRMK